SSTPPAARSVSIDPAHERELLARGRPGQDPLPARRRDWLRGAQRRARLRAHPPPRGDRGRSRERLRPGRDGGRDDRLRSPPRGEGVIVPAPPVDGPIVPAATPTFSVVVAAYQAAETIGEAIESALAQTVPPHEIVVCDDGSTDDLDAALAPFRGRIVLIRQ